MFSWENRRVLITGISGFVGTALASTLEKKGANVYGISRSKESKNIQKTSILNKTEMEKLIDKKKISILFHLAGEVLVEAGQIDPYHTFKTNILGTLNILEIARSLSIEKVIISSTLHVYGKNEVPFKEEYYAQPSRPYETSKAAADIIAQSYADAFALPVLIPRFVNIYGPQDLNFTRLIPKTLRSIFLEGKIHMWGGNATREFLFLDDAVNAYVKLGEVDQTLIEKNRIFNFGSGETISVKDIIGKLIALSRVQCTVEKIKPGREDEISKQYVSSAKAKRLLGWEARTSLGDGLKATVDWYREYFKK